MGQSEAVCRVPKSPRVGVLASSRAVEMPEGKEMPATARRSGLLSGGTPVLRCRGTTGHTGSQSCSGLSRGGHDGAQTDNMREESGASQAYRS